MVPLGFSHYQDTFQNSSKLYMVINIDIDQYGKNNCYFLRYRPAVLGKMKFVDLKSASVSVCFGNEPISLHNNTVDSVDLVSVLATLQNLISVFPRTRS